MMGKKLLILGIDSATRDILNYAKSQHVYTIITDYREAEEVPLKYAADEYWTIDISDFNHLEAKCKQEGITAVTAGNHEFCLDCTKELCRRLGLPFFASDDTWSIVRNKVRIKEEFRKAGLDVPKRYEITKPFTSDQLKAVHYPVIVKPSDSNGERGLSLCRSEEELRQGYEKALEYSANKQIIVEDFIDGEEVNIAYYVEDGIPHQITICDNLTIEVNGRSNISVVALHSRYYEECAAKVNDQLENLIRRIGCRNGHILFQAIRKDGVYYFLEANHRLSGGGYWVLMKDQIGCSYLEWMVDLALGRKPVIDWEQIDLEDLSRNALFYFYWTRPGVVAQVCGLEAVRQMEYVNITLDRFHEGDCISQTDDFSQIAWFIQLRGNTRTEMIDKLRYINQNLKLIDQNGDNMMIPYEDYEDLFKYY